jgi:glycosyltransferase involved in cell wall biosynthesis
MPASDDDPNDDWTFLGGRVLVVSPFPPAREGIARYAAQLVEAIEPGRTVSRLPCQAGTEPGVTPLWGWFAPLRIALMGRRFDDVLVMYHPHYFVRGQLVVRKDLPSRLAGYLALALVAKTVRPTFVIHELDDSRPAQIGRWGKAGFWLEERVRRRLWGRAHVAFHTEWERRRFAERFPARGKRVERIVAHGAFFTSAAGEVTREDARRALGLPLDRTLLLCIGFFEERKGFERAIAAMRGVRRSDLELHVVGSPVYASEEVQRYVAELRREAAQTPAVHLHERFVSDDEFDQWIQAVDAVVTPYTQATSSGVIERVHLAGTSLITRAVGGLDEQAHPDDIRFQTDQQLTEVMQEFVPTDRGLSA